MGNVNLIKDETVFFGLQAANREECMQLMTDGMVRAGFVADKKVYLQAVNEREQKGSTGIGFGVAIPHGKSGGVVSTGLAFARLAEPVEWNSLDGNPVEIVFLIGVPEEDDGNEHIKILVALSRRLIHAEFRQKLLTINSSAELYAVLQSI